MRALFLITITLIVYNLNAQDSKTLIRNINNHEYSYKDTIKLNSNDFNTDDILLYLPHCNPVQIQIISKSKRKLYVTLYNEFFNLKYNVKYELGSDSLMYVELSNISSDNRSFSIDSISSFVYDRLWKDVEYSFTCLEKRFSQSRFNNILSKLNVSEGEYLKVISLIEDDTLDFKTDDLSNREIRDADNLKIEQFLTVKHCIDDRCFCEVVPQIAILVYDKDDAVQSVLKIDFTTSTIQISSLKKNETGYDSFTFFPTDFFIDFIRASNTDIPNLIKLREHYQDEIDDYNEQIRYNQNKLKYFNKQ